MYRVIRFNPRYDEYLDYLENHIRGVIKCWEDVIRPAIEESEDDFFSTLDLDKVSLQIYNHDRSKYTEDEFIGYCNHWYPLDGSEVEHDSKKPEGDRLYDYAWSHHQHFNPHHSQYWLVVRDDGSVKPLDMPLKYVCELLADWGSFHYNDPKEEKAAIWWKKNKKRFIMSDATVDAINRILKICDI